jgi:aminopeptidase N
MSANSPRAAAPKAIYLKDYTPPAWWVETVDLHVTILDGCAEVKATLGCRRNEAQRQDDLVLNGEELALQKVSIDGTPLPASRYALDAETLTIRGPLPDRFVLETLVRIEPDRNTQLSGLYKSADGYFTQCEAQGFRRITFFPDRPDVMARYTCTVEADAQCFPQLLSNGNLVATGQGEAGRHWAKWQDPFAKPCYLFALVAAKLDVLEDRFTTRSGRKVRCAVYVEPGTSSTSAAMRWRR